MLKEIDQEIAEDQKRSDSLNLFFDSDVRTQQNKSAFTYGNFTNNWLCRPMMIEQKSFDLLSLYNGKQPIFKNVKHYVRTI